MSNDNTFEQENQALVAKVRRLRRLAIVVWACCALAIGCGVFLWLVMGWREEGIFRIVKLLEKQQETEARKIIEPSEEPVFLDAAFWSERTHEAEAHALRHLSDHEIDGIIDEVASVIDEDLLRFNPLVAYYGRFAQDGDSTRMEWEREAAHSLKRDLAWAAIERAIDKPGFFCDLLPWYERGRWPVGWTGKYPAGHVRAV